MSAVFYISAAVLAGGFVLLLAGAAIYAAIVRGLSEGGKG